VVSAGTHGNVTWERPVFTDNSGVPVEMQASHVPGTFPLGTTPVTYKAFDSHGNNSTCTIDIVVTSRWNNMHWPQ
jgi:CUB/sushi domain-containing protein